MFRTVIFALLIIGLARPCLAQPPVELVGTSEQICAAEPQLTCPLPQLSHGVGLDRDLGDKIKFQPNGFDKSYAVSTRDDERGPEWRWAERGQQSGDAAEGADENSAIAGLDGGHAI